MLVCRPPKDRFLRPRRLLSVPPGDIVDRSCLPYSALRDRGCGWVLGGDWDELGYPFADDSRYRAVRDVVTRGSRWQDTDMYMEAVKSLDQGQPVWHCRTREELDRRCEVLDDLVETIHRDGFLTQRQLRGRRTPMAQLGRQEEVSVLIGRHGDILFRDGAHRLAIAKVVGTPLIPVEVGLRHADWGEFRRQIECYADAHGGRVPQRLLHPDLDDIPALQSCDRRFRLVLEALSEQCTVLDLTPGWGYFCQRLELQGFTCTALEPSSEDARFLAKLRRASNRSFDVIPSGRIGALPEVQRTFDAALLLSDGLSAGSRVSAAESLAALSLVNVRQVFVEPEAFVEHEAASGDGNLSSARFLEALADATGHRTCARLGWSAEAGPLYRLA